MWKSTDSGETWKEISTNDGFAEGILGIMGITVSPANSNRLYAMVENQKKVVYTHLQMQDQLGKK